MGIKADGDRRVLQLEPPLLCGLPKRTFAAILADPPWKFYSYAKSKNPDSDRCVERHYQTMTLGDIMSLPIRDYAHPDSHLFLWATGPCLPQALKVMEAWGFRYSGIAFVWIKLRRKLGEQPQIFIMPSLDFHIGLGFTTRKNSEFVLLGRRGNARRIAKDVRELIVAPVREHSRKPDEINGRIERYCAGPYLELFGRREVPGWTVRGDEVGKFNEGTDGRTEPNADAREKPARARAEKKRTARPIRAARGAVRTGVDADQG